MKKVLSFVLVMAMICSLGVSVFAAGSPVVVESGSGKKDVTSPLPKITAKAGAGEDEFLFDVNDLATDSAVEEISAKVYPLGKADELSSADAEAFKAAYEDIKAVTNGVVKYFFWLDLGGYEVPEGSYIAFSFECDGDDVAVFCNGEAVEVVDGYTAKLPGGGAIAIVTA